jgi:hypothetical protein
MFEDSRILLVLFLLDAERNKALSVRTLINISVDWRSNLPRDSSKAGAGMLFIKRKGLT